MDEELKKLSAQVGRIAARCELLAKECGRLREENRLLKARRDEAKRRLGELLLQIPKGV